MALRLQDFERIRAIVAGALEYAEAHQNELPLSGYFTHRQLRDLRLVIENIDFRIARLSGAAGPELGRMVSALQADLERTRAELLAHVEQLKDDRTPGAIAITRYGVHVVGRALEGDANREEVLDCTDAIRQYARWRRDHGDLRYAEDRARWAEVLQRLADNLPGDLEDWHVSELLDRPASDRDRAG
ncbi:MAG: hypothetical protein J2P59_06520 [Acidimicrobiales bacterium]|nr:hypothetical protein [Acidimicrobiales bacterium]